MIGFRMFVVALHLWIVLHHLHAIECGLAPALLMHLAMVLGWGTLGAIHASIVRDEWCRGIK